jgi:hypothetical protein
MKIIDTSIFIDHLRNHAPATTWLIAQDSEEVLFSAITETELLAGQANNDESRREKLMQMLQQYTKVVVDNPTASLAGDIRRRYKIFTPDAIIAASALLCHAELITKNVKDFKKVPGLRISSPY